MGKIITNAIRENLLLSSKIKLAILASLRNK